MHLPGGFRALTVLALTVLLLLEIIGDQEVHAVRAQVEAYAITEFKSRSRPALKPAELPLFVKFSRDGGSR